MGSHSNSLHVKSLPSYSLFLISPLSPTSERLSHTDPNPDASQPSLKPYVLPSSHLRATLDADIHLRELHLVKTWLESTHPIPPPLLLRKGHRPVTHASLDQARRVGGVKDSDLGGLELDATFREGKERVEGDDENWEKLLVKHLWQLVRSGRLREAVEVCKESDQGWRATSLLGGEVFWDEKLANGEGMEVDVDVEGGSVGNLNRMLWKKTCRNLALSVTFPSPLPI
jgi:nuclear pore complex protein Nup107